MTSVAVEKIHSSFTVITDFTQTVSAIAVTYLSSNITLTDPDLRLHAG